MFTGTKQQLLAWLESLPDDGKVYEVKEYKRRKRRTLTQNAYYWQLLNKLARILGMGEHETHLHMLREYGVATMVEVRADVPLKSYFKYFDEVMTYDTEEGQYRSIKYYKGSSQMDKAEFTKLLQGMIEECEAQGIDTRTPAEVASMKWIENYEND